MSNMSDERVPIEDVLSGVTIHPLDEDEVVVGAFVLIKVLDKDGDVGWSFRTSEPPNKEELLGALTVQVDLVRKSLLSDWDVD